MGKQQVGVLEKGKLVVTEGELANSQAGEIKFLFNPSEYAISKSNDWNTQPQKGKNIPKYDFAGGKPRTLTLELLFDTTRPSANADDQGKKNDVREYTNKLFKFMMVDKGAQTKGRNSQMSKPPKCRLFWGGDSQHLFECYIQQCSVKYTMFSPDGWPIRATATLTLLEALDKADRPGTNPTSLGEPGRKVRQVKEGDRLDYIAFQEYGDAQEWRRIADANKLSNPLDLRPGMTLAIPPR